VTERGRGRPRPADVGRLLVAWGTSTVALIVADALLPGLSATTQAAWLAVAAVSGVAGLLVRPVLVEASARLGWVLVLPVALVGQALLLYGGMVAVPAITGSFWSAFLASWITAGVGTFIEFCSTAGTDDALVSSLARRGRRAGPLSDPDVPGVLFVQVDGVPFPVLHWAVQSGAVPTMRRWLGTGGHVMHEWTPQLPCTTPASQLGILHGTVEGVPAFRWYDRELGRVLVASRPADARVIEERATNGRGLLADDGVSISNIFTGDAPRSLMTMSRVEMRRGSTQTRRAFAWFLASPSGFARSLSRTLAEVVKERWQARRQVARNFEPRVHRSWTFAMLRALTNALLRDLNTALVAEEMRRGTHAIYVDYVDYDEIAHHAGLFRPESLAALDGLDRVLKSLETLAELAPRRYHLVVLSDHGQSQGQPFEDRYDLSLGDLCTELMAQPVSTIADSVEGWGRAESVVGDVSGPRGFGRLVGRADNRLQSHYVERGRDEEAPVVLGSGNLGLLYLREPTRLSLDRIGERFPRLVPGLAAHPGVGFVAGLDAQGLPWAIGESGRRNLSTGDVEGSDPLIPFGQHAARVLRRALEMPEAPDLYVNSTVDPITLDVAAFEGLVGAHGGLGGWQDRAVLLVPRALENCVPEHVEGADVLHEALVAMLRACGHRTEIRDALGDASPPVDHVQASARGAASRR
jgi:uncharacterized membrane protein YvlD (DUF360 family)